MSKRLRQVLISCSVVSMIGFAIGSFFTLGSAALSAREGTSKNLKMLLALGVPPDSMTWQASTAMAYATRYRQRDTMALLAAKGADLRHALLIAAAGGDLETLDFLAQIRPLNTLRGYRSDRTIDYALLRSSERVDAKTCAYLIRIGADPNYRDPDTGDTPLSIIANSPRDYPVQEKNDTIKVLVDAGAKTNRLKKTR